MLLTALLAALFAILGLTMGSFLNVCIDRLPAGRSIIRPPSTCDACNQRLSVIDLVPVFSYLWLRGRCHYCHAPIPRRVPAVELAMGAGFPLLHWHHGLTPLLGMSLVYLCLFTIIFVVDIEHHIIPDKAVYSGMVLALAFSLFNPALGENTAQRIISAVLGGAAGLIIMLLPFLISRGGMGFGDVKMATLIGLITGFPTVFVALFLSIIAGGLAATALLVLHLKKRREAIPFGPFLAAGTMLVIILGSQLQNWYQQLMG